MKILYITSDISLPSEHGGSSHVTGISESLRDLGHEVTIALKKEKGQKFKEKIEGINYIRFPILPTKIGKLISHFFTSIIASTFIKYDILYERARIFGGSGCIISNLKKKKCLYSQKCQSFLKNQKQKQNQKRK